MAVNWYDVGVECGDRSFPDDSARDAFKTAWLARYEFRATSVIGPLPDQDDSLRLFINGWMVARNAPDHKWPVKELDALATDDISALLDGISDSDIRDTLKRIFESLIERIKSLEEAYAHDRRYCIQRHGDVLYDDSGVYATEELAELALQKYNNPSEYYVAQYEDPGPWNED